MASIGQEIDDLILLRRRGTPGPSFRPIASKSFVSSDLCDS